jgi:hypothetical protein
MKAFLHPNRIPAPLSSAFLHDQDPKQTSATDFAVMPANLRRRAGSGPVHCFTIIHSVEAKVVWWINWSKPTITPGRSAAPIQQRWNLMGLTKLVISEPLGWPSQ